MKTATKTLEKLRRNNWNVKVTHFRNINQQANKKSPMELVPNKELGSLGLDLSRSITKGGRTVVSLTPPGSQTEFIGESVCSFKETFNRRLSLNIAAGRALKSAGLKNI